MPRRCSENSAVVRTITPGIVIYGGPRSKSLSGALQDFTDGMLRYEFWHRLAWNDVKARYRRSTIGEFWLVISLGVFVLSVGTVYGMLLNMSPATYLPHLTTGYVLWLLFSQLIVEGCQTFIGGAGVLRQQRLPLSAFVLRNVDRAFITLAHNMVVVVVVLAVFTVRQNWNLLLLFPALALWWMNGMWLCFVLGTVSARFRDVPQIVANVIPILFLVSPVLWSEASVPTALQRVAAINPLTHFLAIARNPLLGTDVPMLAWEIVGAVTIAGWIIAAFVFRSYRTRICYWI